MTIRSMSVPALLAYAATPLALALCAFTATPVSGQNPVVVTEFLIEAEALVIPASDQSAVETELARLMANRGREYFPYLEWVTASGTHPDTARFTVSARQGTRQIGSPPVLCYRIDLELEGQIPEETPGSFMVIVLEEGVEVVPLCQPLSSTKSALSDRLTGVLESMFSSDVFRRNLQDRLLSRISLTDSFELYEQRERVVFPVYWRSLQADPETSKILLKFKCEERDVLAELDQGEELDDAEKADWVGFTSWSPNSLRIGSDEFQVGRFDSIKSLQEAGSLHGIGVFMKNFVKAHRKAREDIFHVSGS